MWGGGFFDFYFRILFRGYFIADQFYNSYSIYIVAVL
jgi:hypothetical protein